jgi:hypothetical protein
MDPLTLTLGGLAVFAILRNKPVINVTVNGAETAATESAGPGPGASELSILDTPHAELIDSMNPPATPRPGPAPAAVPYSGAPAVVPLVPPVPVPTMRALPMPQPGVRVPVRPSPGLASAPAPRAVSTLARPAIAPRITPATPGGSIGRSGLVGRRLN